MSIGATEPDAWEAWNVSGSTIKAGTEAEVKQFVEERRHQQELSIVSPDGNEYILEGGRWVPV